MNTPKLLLFRCCLALGLLWGTWASDFAADEPEQTPTVQPEAENPPLVQPPRKRGKRRPATHHFTSQNEVVQIGKDVVVASGETVRELVVIGGDATVDGTVEGNLIVISGSAKVNGHVERELVTILGSVTLGPEAQIGQDAVVVGGPLNIDPKATIGGQQTVVGLGQVLPDFTWLQSWLTKGLLLARPFPPQVKWVWVVAGLFLLVYLALTVMFPRPVRACVRKLEEQPVASFFVGILLLILLGPLILLLVVSVAGVMVIPFVVCALIAAALFGKVAVYSYAGQQVGRQMHVPEPSLPLILLIGAVLFYLLYMVPVLGFALWGIVTLVGLGAVLLACFGSVRREDAPAYVAAPVLGLGAAQAAAVPAAGVPPQAVPPLVSSSDAMLMPRVGFWRRLWATVLDFLLLGMLIHLTGGLFLLVWAAYFVAMWTWKGTTIGGIVMGIKIVRTDGRPINFAVALVRCLSSFFSAFALFLGFFWAGWDRERQAWHDKIAGTVVVKVPKGVSLI